MSAPNPHLETIPLGVYETNCFIVSVPAAATQHAWIVDCGFEPEPLFARLDERGLTPRGILLTHAHPDHIAGVDAALARYGDMPVSLHVAERGFCSDPMLNLSALLGEPVTCREPDQWLEGGETLDLDGTTWRVVPAPGHSPGCILFVNDAADVALVGDTLFAGSIGRIDFPTSDPDAMRHTIAEVVMKLPDTMTIHPGHGPSTTIGRERRSNPFVVAPW